MYLLGQPGNNLGDLFRRLFEIAGDKVVVDIAIFEGEALPGPL